MENLKVGDRVVVLDEELERYNMHEDATRRGTVKAEPQNGKVIVEFISKYYNKASLEEMDVLSLVSEMEADKILSKLEIEFEAWSNQAKEKIKEAATLLAEAGKITQTHGHELYEMYDLTRPLLHAMDHCGWNTSSFNC